MENEKQEEKQACLTVEDMQEFFQANADNYRFLSQMTFKELTSEAIDELAEATWPTDTGNEHLDQGYRYLRRYFKFSQGDRTSQLACEYARIFLAAGIYGMDKKVACPYESIFTSEDHNVMGASRDDVLRIFREDGFQVNPSLHEPEDHLSFELEYLSTMNERALRLLAQKDERGLRTNIQRQIDFMERHLLNWLPDLLDMAQNYAKLAFYLGMLNVCLGSLETARDMLDAVRTDLPEALQAAA